MKAWEHPFLAHLVATVHDDAYLYFIMEFLSGGDLMHWIQKGAFSPKQSVYYAAEIALGKIADSFYCCFLFHKISSPINFRPRISSYTTNCLP